MLWTCTSSSNLFMSHERSITSINLLFFTDRELQSKVTCPGWQSLSIRPRISTCGPLCLPVHAVPTTNFLSACEGTGKARKHPASDTQYEAKCTWCYKQTLDYLFSSLDILLRGCKSFHRPQLAFIKTPMSTSCKISHMPATSQDTKQKISG